jgi:hypothetical protein
MSDRELLEAAAKAAGIDWADGHESTGLRDQNGKVWNPLTDDGDALRLAVKLRLTVNCSYDDVTLCGQEFTQKEVFLERNGEDPLAATRRAVVRAAAEIGNGTTQKVSTDDLPEDNYYKTQAEAEELGRSMK